MGGGFGGDRRSGSSGVRYAHSHHRLRGGPPAIKRGCLGLQNLNLRCRYSIFLHTHEFSPYFLQVCSEMPLFPDYFTTHPQLFAGFLVGVFGNAPLSDHFCYTPTSFRPISCMCVPEPILWARSWPEVTELVSYQAPFGYICHTFMNFARFPVCGFLLTILEIMCIFADYY